MSKDLIVKSNALVEAGYQLTTNEQRLILCAIACIPKGEPVNPNTGYCVSKGNFVDLGVNPKTANREIREACDRLFNRYVTIKSEQGEFKTRWVQDITKYDQDWALHNRDWFIDAVGEDPDEEDCILASITFSRSVIPFLTELKSNFTKYMLSDVAGFSSSYSFRMYEFMMQFKSTGYVKIGIRELRERLDLVDKYPATKDLRLWVIEPAIKEINEKSPYKVDCNLIKTGKKFTHLELRFKQKEKTKPLDQKDPNTIDMLHGLTDKELVIVRQKVADYIAHLESKGQSVNDFHRKNIEQKAIADRWGLDEYYEQLQKAENERLARKEQAERERQAKLAEQAEKQRQESENRAFIAYFESLPQDEQGRILDEVYTRLGEKLGGLIERKTAHTHPMARHIFKQVMGV